MAAARRWLAELVHNMCFGHLSSYLHRQLSCLSYPSSFAVVFFALVMKLAERRIGLLSPYRRSYGWEMRGRSKRLNVVVRRRRTRERRRRRKMKAPRLTPIWSVPTGCDWQFGKSLILVVLCNLVRNSFQNTVQGHHIPRPNAENRSAI